MAGRYLTVLASRLKFLHAPPPTAGIPHLSSRWRSPDLEISPPARDGGSLWAPNLPHFSHRSRRNLCPSRDARDGNPACGEANDPPYLVKHTGRAAGRSPAAPPPGQRRTSTWPKSTSSQVSVCARVFPGGKMAGGVCSA